MYVYINCLQLIAKCYKFYLTSFTGKGKTENDRLIQVPHFQILHTSD